MMDEQDSGRAEFEKRQSQISPGSIDWYRDRLNDEAFARDYPQAHAALRQSVDRALAASQQSLDTPPDGRSAAATEHDRRYGVTYQDGRIALPNDLAAAIERQASTETPDPYEVAEQLAGVGLDPIASKAAAALLLSQVGSPVKVEQLGAHQIATLSHFAGHLQRHAAGRPQ